VDGSAWPVQRRETRDSSEWRSDIVAGLITFIALSSLAFATHARVQALPASEFFPHICLAMG
jgi:hypothetical protein